MIRGYAKAFLTIVIDHMRERVNYWTTPIQP
jgi:hypothetical protein